VFGRASQRARTWRNKGILSGSAWYNLTKKEPCHRAVTPGIYSLTSRRTHTSLGVVMLTTLTTIITSIVAVITGIAAVGGFLFGVYQYRRNVQLSTFRVYADKYNSILTPDIYDKWYNALCGDEENWTELTPTMIAYLNLIWEESYLVRNGVISKLLWRIWEPEARATINTDFAEHIIERYQYHFPLASQPSSI